MHGSGPSSQTDLQEADRLGAVAPAGRTAAGAAYRPTRCSGYLRVLRPSGAHEAREANRAFALVQSWVDRYVPERLGRAGRAE